jgi:hypothetical protein
MTTYGLAEAEDGYKVVFALAELDPEFNDSEIIVADTVDGAPIDAKCGPLLRRSPKATHLCFLKVTHPKNRIRNRI